MTSNRHGYRGYICARMGMGRSAPQHIQQMVMRDYCARRDMRYLLAATEYCMPGCTMILDAVLDELDQLEGIVMYSLALLPQKREKRLALYRRLFEKGCSLHLAAENIRVANRAEADALENTFLVKDIMGAQSPQTLAWLAEYDGKAHA